MTCGLRLWNRSASIRHQSRRWGLLIACAALVASIGLTQNNCSFGSPPNNYVTATFTPIGQNGSQQSVVTVTGDDAANYVNISWKAGVVTISTTGLTRIGTAASSTTSVSFHTGSSFVVVGTLNGGDDYVLVTSLSTSSANFTLGSGNDQIKFTYCAIADLTLDGGTGTNTLSELTTRITNSVITNIQVLLPPGL